MTRMDQSQARLERSPRYHLNLTGLTVVCRRLYFYTGGVVRERRLASHERRKKNTKHGKDAVHAGDTRSVRGANDCGAACYVPQASAQSPPPPTARVSPLTLLKRIMHRCRLHMLEDNTRSSSASERCQEDGDPGHASRE
ncbi:unnamed protein product [Danaus chrysippus]|uniref:(African queen) hypothetical protein n=1 Tax=Danaus chrysippus TaxID=151541 RepID=A0A8J2QSA0_9NEOP|nr:unnamed protein product [Danaus chrysippus]